MDDEAGVVEQDTSETVTEVIEPVQEDRKEEKKEAAEKEAGLVGDEVIVTIGDNNNDEEDQAKAPEWVNELRKKSREITKENKRLKAALEDKESNKPLVLGTKPSIDDFDYDKDEYEKSLDVWYEKKSIVTRQQNDARIKQDEQARSWEQTLSDYSAKKNELKAKAPGFDEAEQISKDALSDMQQSIIIQGANDPALLMLALGKNPAKAQALALIKDPAKFIWEVSRIESQLKVTQRKVSTNPEQKVSSGKSSGSSLVNATLDSLREDAAKTGDHSKVFKYKQSLRKA